MTVSHRHVFCLSVSGVCVSSPSFLSVTGRAYPSPLTIVTKNNLAVRQQAAGSRQQQQQQQQRRGGGPTETQKKEGMRDSDAAVGDL